MGRAFTGEESDRQSSCGCKPLNRRTIWNALCDSARVGASFDREVPKLLKSHVSTEGFPSGQREQTVNLPALPSKVRILPPPPFGCRGTGNRSSGTPHTCVS